MLRQNKSNNVKGRIEVDKKIDSFVIGACVPVDKNELLDRE